MILLDFPEASDSILRGKWSQAFSYKKSRKKRQRYHAVQVGPTLLLTLAKNRSPNGDTEFFDFLDSVLQ